MVIKSKDNREEGQEDHFMVGRNLDKNRVKLKETKLKIKLDIHIKLYVWYSPSITILKTIVFKRNKAVREKERYRIREKERGLPH